MADTATIEAKQDQVKQVVEAAFAALPNTGEEIAAFFQVRDIKGSHHNADCPMAVYLKGELAKAGLTDLHVWVNSSRVAVLERAANLDEWPLTKWEVSWIGRCKCGCDATTPGYPELPAKVSKFVEMHDDGKFPEIDTKREDAAPVPVVF